MNGGLLKQLLERSATRPILVDIGASGKPPGIWKPIASGSIYIGFDPDQRDLRELPEGEFQKTFLVNEAVTDVEGRTEVTFHLTRSPHCSSTLPPDAASLSQYLFSDLFTVEKQTPVRAATLNAILDRLSLTRVDWLKTDSQGTDLRLFKSLKDETRSHVLAVDIEPGLIDAYAGEDLFVDAHRAMLRDGFWLSDLNVRGAVRMRRATAQEAFGERAADLDTRARKSPAWCEAAYLRTLESVNSHPRDLTLLWIFASLQNQHGFALDVVTEYEKRIGRDGAATFMKDESLSRLGRYTHNGLFRRAKSFVPASMKNWLKKIAGVK